MGEVLTQSQIDALLNSVQNDGFAEDSGDDEAMDKKVRKYDFHTPKKFTKDRMKLISSVYENYARVIASHLTSMLRLNCELELVDVEEQRYYEFNNALSEDDIIAFVDTKIVDTKDDDLEPVMFQMSKQVIYAMIDRMLGGNGDMIEEEEDEGTNSGYTEIELSLYSSIMQHIAPIMDDAWGNYLEVGFQYHRIETNPRLVQAVGIDEIVLIVMLDVKIKETEGKMNICLPGSVLDSIFETFERNTIVSNKRREYQSEEDRCALAKSVEDSKLDIQALMGEAYIALEDLYQLKVNDVLNMHVPCNSDVFLCVEGKPWFKGKLGVYKENMAVKINGAIIKS